MLEIAGQPVTRLAQPAMDEFHALMERFAQIGATPGGGICRLAASAEDGAARDLLVKTLAAGGARVQVDSVGNVFGVFALAPRSESCILVGSHLDSQPTGGRFDGTYGVLAATVCAKAIAETCRQHKAPAPQHNLVVVDWTNEEGARFQPSLTGSSVFTGALAAADALKLRDPEGIMLEAALDQIGYLGRTTLTLTPRWCVELHVEQGDRLEVAGAEIGVVTGAWAARKIRLRFIGEASHTGPTPMARRRDAMRSAARAITSLYDLAEAEGAGLHVSAAKIEVYPNSPNVVPAEVRVWFEIRHDSEALPKRIGDRILAETRAQAHNISVEVEKDELRGTATLDPEGVKLAASVSESLGYATLPLRTVAGHDALALQRRFPTILTFVPSRDGLSHNEREFTDDASLERGLHVLHGILGRLLYAAD